MGQNKMRPACWVSLFLVMFFLAGCGGSKSWKAWTDSGFAVEKDGQVIYCVVDSFDKGFYDIDELTGMAVEEVALFNGKNRSGEGTPASVEEVAAIEGSNGLVRVVYRFDKPDTYGAFLGESLFYGSLEEAVAEKLIFEGEVLLNGSETIVLDEKNRTRFSGNHVIVTSSKTVIRPPYDVLWYCDGVEILEDESVNAANCTDTVVLLLKK